MSLGSMLQALFVKITADTAGFGKGVSDIGHQVDSMTRNLGDRMQGIGNKMMGIGGAMTVGVTGPLAAFGAASIKAASDAQELGSAFGFTFGKMAAETEAWAERTGNVIGRSTQDLQQYSMTAMQLFGQAFGPNQQAQAASMSRQFAQLAVDLGSFFNVADAEAMNALRSGLTGEAEPLRRFGIFLNEAAVKAKALEMGLKPVGKELTDQQKILARSQLILEATTAAQGDAERTAGSLANQQRAMAAAFQEAQVTIGQAFLPLATKLATFAADLLNKFNGLSEGTQNFIIAGAGIAAVLGPVIATLGMFASGIGALLGAGGLAGLAAALGAVALPVGAVVAAFLLFKDDVIPVLTELGAKVKDVLGPSFEKLVSAFSELAAGPLGQAFKGILDQMGAVVALWTSTFGEVLIRSLNAFMVIVTGVFEGLNSMFKLFGAFLRGDWSAVWKEMGNMIGTTMRMVLGVIEAIVPGSVDAMKRLYEGVKSWLLDKLTAVFDAVRQKAKQVGDAFYELWDRVVGHSYVPDMVIKIGEWFNRLPGLMQGPANDAASSVEDRFQNMAQNIGSIFSSIKSGNWGGALGSLGSLIGGKWGGLLQGVGGLVSAIKGGGGGGSSPAYNLPNVQQTANSPVPVGTTYLQQTVHVHANDAVLASTVKGWTQQALQEARAAVPMAVAAATELVPAEMARTQSGSFV